jgi:hypothetical protein
VGTVMATRPAAPWESWVIIIGGGFVLLGLVISLVAFARLFHGRANRGSLQDRLALFALVVTSFGISGGFVGSTFRENREYSGLGTPKLVAALIVVFGLAGLVALLHFSDRSSQDN